jgi:hypothetical protein
MGLNGFRMRLPGLFWLAVGLLLAFPALAQEKAPPAAGRRRPPPTAEQLAAWVKQLDADEFLARETAMLSLIEAGPAAIAPLTSPVAPLRSIEAATRATHVLQSLGLSPDFDVQEEARAALIEMAARKELPQLARRASATLLVLTEQRAAQSLVELESLGVKVSRSQLFNGFAVEDYVYSLEIGSDFRGTDQDLRRLKWLPETRVLILAGPKATDAWLKHAAAMDRLSELHLYESATTDAGLALFENHAALTQVGLYYTTASDEALSHLQKLPALNFVKLYGTKITREAVEKFQAATGLAKVDHRKGAFLGVGCQNFDGACLISTVHENSPAERAGLERDDQLIRFGDAKVIDFETLTTQISQRDSGEEVEIEVQRQVLDDEGKIVLRSIVAKVKLGPWEQDLAVQNGMRP